MSKVTFKGEEVEILGTFPKVGDKVEDFKLTTNILQDVSLTQYQNGKIVLNIFPSIDTETCSASVRTFNEEATKFSDTTVLCISKDLPFAQARFCGAENIKNVQTLSAFRDRSFDKNYGVGINCGLLRGLLTRAVIVLDRNLNVVYTEMIPEITNKPNYAKCIEALNNTAY